MGMEHRAGSRRKVNVDIVLDTRPLGLRRGRVLNISVGGAFVYLRPMTTKLITDNPINMIFKRYERNVCRIYRLPAIITRFQHNGVGLMFTEMQAATFYSLLAILFADEQRKRKQVIAS